MESGCLYKALLNVSGLFVIFEVYALGMVNANTINKIANNQKIYTSNCDVIAAIEKAKRDILKWMFIFWIGQLAATAEILFAFLNASLKK